MDLLLMTIKSSIYGPIIINKAFKIAYQPVTYISSQKKKKITKHWFLMGDPYKTDI